MEYTAVGLKVYCREVYCEDAILDEHCSRSRTIHRWDVVRAVHAREFPQPGSTEADLANPKRSGYQLRSSAGAVPAMGPLVVDSDVRCGVRLDPHWPVREQ